jgi:predicted Zn-dependent protease
MTATTGSEDYSRTLRVVCEEIGHSVGLDHQGTSDSCMSASTAAHLDGHDKYMINQHY